MAAQSTILKQKKKKLDTKRYCSQCSEMRPAETSLGHSTISSIVFNSSFLFVLENSEQNGKSVCENGATWGSQKGFQKATTVRVKE